MGHCCEFLKEETIIIQIFIIIRLLNSIKSSDIILFRFNPHRIYFLNFNDLLWPAFKFKDASFSGSPLPSFEFQRKLVVVRPGFRLINSGI